MMRRIFKGGGYLIGGASVVIVAAVVQTAAAGIDLPQFGSEWAGVEVGQFEAPMALVAQPGTNGMLLAERAGRVQTIAVSDDGSFLHGPEVLDISDRVSTEGESGLTSVAISLSGDELYVSYTDTDSKSRIVAYPMEHGKPVTAASRLLLTINQPGPNHNANQILTDRSGRLLISVGDGYANEHGQDPSTLHGTLLRIDVTADGDSAYTVPDDNPFAGPSAEVNAPKQMPSSPNYRPEILAFGLRNPWRFDLDPTTGDLWVSDVGVSRREEINYLSAKDINSGANFGWAAMEGSLEFDGSEPDRHVRPVHEYPHESEKGWEEALAARERCSVIGGVVVRGGYFPKHLDGAYLFSDYCDGRIRALVADDSSGWTTYDLGVTVPLPVSFGRGKDGAVYVLSLEGKIYELVYDFGQQRGCPAYDAEHTVGWFIGEVRCRVRHLEFHWSWPRS